MEGSQPQSAGEARKATQEGRLPVGTVQQILERAPEDLVEEEFDVPEWNCSVKLKAFSAAAASRIKSVGFNFVGEQTDVAWGEMEKAQFQQGVIEPVFSDEDVVQLHITSGRGFARVIKRLDELSNLDKEAVKKAQEEFRGSDKSS